MRTTVDLDEALLERAKKAALGEQRTLGAVLNDALRAYFAGRRAVAKDPPFEVVVHGNVGDRFPTPAELEQLEDEELLASLALSTAERRAAP
jgi:hypothetical protein